MEAYSRYFEADLDLSSDTAPAMLCNDCSYYGPPLRSPLTQLSAGELKALEVLAAGGNVGEAARASGVHPETMRRKLKGQERDVFRQAWQWLMVRKGLDPLSLIGTMADGLLATKHQWNPEEKAFEEFPDHSNRLKTVQMAIKAHDLNPPTELSRDPTADRQGGGGVTVVFQTNLDGKGDKNAAGAYEIDVTGQGDDA